MEPNIEERAAFIVAFAEEATANVDEALEASARAYDDLYYADAMFHSQSEGNEAEDREIAENYAKALLHLAQKMEELKAALEAEAAAIAVAESATEQEIAEWEETETAYWTANQ